MAHWRSFAISGTKLLLLAPGLLLAASWPAVASEIPLDARRLQPVHLEVSSVPYSSNRRITP